MKRWIYRFYNLLVLIVLPFIFLGVLLRWRRRFASGLDRWEERCGRLSAAAVTSVRTSTPVWWVHAVSLGEVKAIEFFLRDLTQAGRVKVLLSLVTPEAIAWATEQKLADLILAAPIDLPWLVRRVFQHVRPQLFVSVESEFWPNLLREARRSGARVALVNGRISARSYRSYRRFKFILPALWENFDHLAVRQQEDAERFVDLGIPKDKITVTGNMKYDMPLPDAPASTSKRGVTLVIGSSREGEERELLPVLLRLSLRVAGLRVIWAPRHIERVQEVESLLAGQGLSSSRKSRSSPDSAHVIWDTMGDLMEAYRQADVAVVGGSFVPKGGQNPLEPASLRVPVVFGPSMENFKGIAEVLVQHGGARQVTLAELEDCLIDLLLKPDVRDFMGRRAREGVQSRQGATEKTIRLLEGLPRA